MARRLLNYVRSFFHGKRSAMKFKCRTWRYSAPDFYIEDNWFASEKAAVKFAEKTAMFNENFYCFKVYDAEGSVILSKDTQVDCEYCFYA